MTEYRELRLAGRPEGAPSAEHWTMTSAAVPEVGDGQFLVEVTHVSLDPAMRGWIDETPSYISPVKLGAVMRANALGRVVASRHDGFPEGAMVSAPFGAREMALSDGRAAQLIDTEQVAPETWLGVLGGTGLTAYFGLLEVGALQPGETVVVSAAAGAVGSVVGQIARLHDCRVIGIAGGEAKCHHIGHELGFDATIDYRGQDVEAELGRLLGPEGADVYFDNVGGPILDAALLHLARDARIVVCGAISQYNATGAWQGPSNYWQLLVKRARMQGFVVFDFLDRYPEAIERLAGWIADGRIRPREEVVDGTLDDFPDALLRLFRGENVGKVVLRLRR